jgi:hypothetical protein
VYPHPYPILALFFRRAFAALTLMPTATRNEMPVPLQKRPGLLAVFEWHFARAILLIACFLNNGAAYVTPACFARALQTTRSTQVFQKSTDYYEPLAAETGEPLQKWDRRSAITTILSPLVLLPLVGVAAKGEPLQDQKQPLQDFDCLCDLPPVPSDCVRVYLCRHGQTENNRLRKVQGARVDPPINGNGILQAKSVGKALSRAVPGPKFIVHSKLLRARMTAEVAAEQMGPPAVDTSNVLEELGEVDFGPVAEGQPILMAMAGMTATYAAWALGDIDYRPAEGGDSGREVSLQYFVLEQPLNKGCIPKKTHVSQASPCPCSFIRFYVAPLRRCDFWHKKQNCRMDVWRRFLIRHIYGCCCP